MDVELANQAATRGIAGILFVPPKFDAVDVSDHLGVARIRHRADRMERVRSACAIVKVSEEPRCYSGGIDVSTLKLTAHALTHAVT